jgi:hypothetical protein
MFTETGSLRLEHLLEEHGILQGSLYVNKKQRREQASYAWPHLRLSTREQPVDARWDQTDHPQTDHQ